MTRPIDLLRQDRKEELWQMCCGFLSLSLEQFMAIQKRLLLEQIELLKNSEMGRRIMGGAMPETIEEFRQQVPLTTYSDYLPDLAEKREEGLPAKPAMWVHTVGRIGEYNFKWVPLPERFLNEFERIAGGIGLLASCDAQGNFLVKEHLKTLATMASRDYGSGVVAYLMQRALGFDLMPANAEEMSFGEKMEFGFKEALSRGLDAFGGLPSILVHFGEMLGPRQIGADTRFLLSHPKAAARLVRGLIRSKLAGRPLLPKDLWSARVVVGGGADSALGAYASAHPAAAAGAPAHHAAHLGAVAESVCRRRGAKYVSVKSNTLDCAFPPWRPRRCARPCHRPQTRRELGTASDYR